MHELYSSKKEETPMRSANKLSCDNWVEPQPGCTTNSKATAKKKSKVHSCGTACKNKATTLGSRLFLNNDVVDGKVFYFVLAFVCFSLSSNNCKANCSVRFVGDKSTSGNFVEKNPCALHISSTSLASIVYGS
jgi:hypothetical protein